MHKYFGLMFLLATCIYNNTQAQVSAQNTGRVAGTFYLGDLLPTDRSGIRLETRRFTADGYFDATGNNVPISSSFDAINLNSTVLPLLAAYGPSATLGTTRVHSDAVGLVERLILAHGITDRLTLGVVVPYARITHHVDIDITGSNLVNNPAFNPSQPLGPGNAPFVPPIGPFAALPRVNVTDVLGLLSNPVYGYGYKSPATVTTSGLGDPSIGAAWRFYQSENTAMILTPSVRIGLSADNDPDDLFDVVYDDSSTDLTLDAAYLHRISRFDIKATAGYTYQTPDHVEARALALGELLVPAARKERLRRELGATTTGALELGWTEHNFRYSARWEYTHQGATDFASPTRQDVSGLEANTGGHANHLRMGVQWSGLDAWRRGSLPMPMLISAEYRDTLRGRNWADTQSLYLVLTAVF